MQANAPYGSPPPGAPQPYGYAQPPPMYGPGPMAPMMPPPPPPFHTREGVKYFSYLLLLEVVLGLISFLIALAAISMIMSLGSGNWGTAWGSIVALAGAGIAILVVGILALVFFIIGWIKFYQGKDEFGPLHAKNFMMAVIFFILGLVIPWVGSAASPGYSYNTNVTDYYNSIRTSLIISGVLGIIGPLFYALMFTTLVKQFTAEEGAKFKIALIMLIVGPVIGLAAAVALFPGKPGTGVTVAQLVSFYSVSVMALSVGAILSLVGYFFFYTGYKSILAKMDSGMIRPGLFGPPPMPMPMPGYGAPPGAYQAPPPAPYPQQPPAQYPPPQYPPAQPPAQYPPPQYPPAQPPAQYPAPQPPPQYPPPQYPPQQPPQYPPPQ